MLSTFIRSLKPAQRLLFFVAAAMLIGGMISLLSVKLLKVFYGISLPEDYALLQDLSQPWAVGANKFLLLVQHVGFLVLPGLLFVILLGKQSFYFGTHGKRLWPAIVLLGISLYPLVTFVAYLNQQIPLPEELLQMENEAGVYTMAIVKAESIGVLLWNLFIVALIPAVGEELVFRGIIQGEMHRVFKNPWVAIVFSALIFSALHMQFGGFIPRFGLGVVLGYLFYRFGNLLAPMLLHFTNNAFALILVYIENPSADNINDFDLPSFDLVSISLVVGGSLLTGYLLYRVNKRLNTL